MSEILPIPGITNARFVTLKAMPEEVVKTFDIGGYRVDSRKAGLAAVRFTFEGIDSFTPLRKLHTDEVPLLSDQQAKETMSQDGAIGQTVIMVADVASDGRMIGQGSIFKPRRTNPSPENVPSVGFSLTGHAFEDDSVSFEARRLRLMALFSELVFHDVLHSDRDSYEEDDTTLAWEILMGEGLAEVEPRDKPGMTRYQFKQQPGLQPVLHTQPRISLQ